MFSIVLLGSCNKPSEYIEIPDENFEYHLILNGIDDYIDGQVLRASAEAATELDLISSGPSGNFDYKITSLSGIEEFINLTRITSRYNELAGTVDISSLVNLVELEIINLTNEYLLVLGDIRNLGYVTAGMLTNTSLDFTNNSNLKRLNLYGELLNCINLKFIAPPQSIHSYWIDCPDLNCVEVSNPNEWKAVYPNGWNGNADIFSINCGC